MLGFTYIKNYKEMLKGYQSSKIKSNAQKETVQFIKQKLDAAKWFIEAITSKTPNTEFNNKCNS